MRNGKITKSIRFMAVLAFFVSLYSIPGLAAEFSADIVLQPTGETAITGKIFVKGTKIRQETTEEGETQVIIVRPDKKVSWMVTPEEKVYIEVPYHEEDQGFQEWTAEQEKKAKYLTDETVSGIPCKKYETMEEGEKTYFWVSKKHSFPIKIQDSETVLEYKNIKDGSVEDSLFEIPAGYEKLSMPSLPQDESSEQ